MTVTEPDRTREIRARLAAAILAEDGAIPSPAAIPTAHTSQAASQVLMHSFRDIAYLLDQLDRATAHVESVWAVANEYERIATAARQAADTALRPAQ